MIRQTRQITPKNSVSDLIFKDECYAIIGACFEVYKDKGCGFYEPVYPECLTIEFEHRAQVLNYLKAARFELGLLVNFGHYPKLQYERVVKTQPKAQSDETIYL